MNLRQKVVVATTDLFILVEVFVSMYFAGKQPDNITLLFLKYFFSMAVPTLVAARIAVKTLKSPQLCTSESEPFNPW
jgi:hypothetical protein